MADKLHIDAAMFKAHTDNLTLWQRRALLLRFELNQMGYGHIAERVFKLNKQQCADELQKWLTVPDSDS